MATKSRHSFEKRKKEVARKKKQEDKAARKMEARKRREETRQNYGSDDPDLAGITPGPQSLPDQWEPDSAAEETLDSGDELKDDPETAS